MKNSKCKIAIFFLLAGLFIGILLRTDRSPLTTVHADTGAPKSTGLTSIPDLEKLGNQELRRVLEQVLREHAAAIDVNYRMLLNDIDTINRDEIPGLKDDIEMVISFDVPLVGADTAWTLPGDVVTWTDATVDYGGTTYTITNGNADASGERWIYWEADNPTAFDDVFTPVVDQDRWYIMYYDGSDLHPALQSTIINGGLIQADTITASQIATGAVRSNEILANTITAGDIAANTITGAQLAAIKMGDITGSPNASGLWMTADYLGFWDNSNSIWNVWLGSDGILHLKDTSGELELEPDDGVRLGRSGGNADLKVFAYSASDPTARGILTLGKSDNATIGSWSETDDTEALGSIVFHGVNSSSHSQAAVLVNVVQTAAAGADYIPGELRLYVTDSTGAQSIFTFEDDGGLSCPGSGNFQEDSGTTAFTVKEPGGNAILTAAGSASIYSFIVKDHNNNTIISAYDVGGGDNRDLFGFQLFDCPLLQFSEVSSDPADPGEGESIIWQSDGTGSGDDGDIMIKITAGGTTKTITLVDFSAF